MAHFSINSEQSMPIVPKYEFEAERYEEDGAFTKFYDADGKEVKALRTDTVLDIKID
ncbi:hypothetical protein [Tsukamurella paurometabola]|uniref:Uncharacterized protein n=1 Tax=Tsukamurella paurometabola TaxID=2061 RepID=A0A3P8JUN4_TSUPA|nr:hypothetical protein [Tsukamurella paurometabola]UEA84493.1 hypothetical protein LK411_06630 [Tsukamurella paurometabola]VDR37059.1 Uncharacterised protein [Tsukamurella paurometabola]